MQTASDTQFSPSREARDALQRRLQAFERTLRQKIELSVRVELCVFSEINLTPAARRRASTGCGNANFVNSSSSSGYGSEVFGMVLDYAGNVIKNLPSFGT